MKLTQNGCDTKIHHSGGVFMDIDESKLKAEMDYFNANCKTWVERYGLHKFVVVFDSKMIGPFDDDVTAYKNGIKEFGIEPFLIQQLTDNNPIEHVPALVLGVTHAS